MYKSNDAIAKFIQTLHQIDTRDDTVYNSKARCNSTGRASHFMLNMLNAMLLNRPTHVLSLRD